MERSRISITLRKNILQKLDKKIDGMRIRNRSHAIEYYLGKALSPQIKRAVILAGGPGTEMRPFTYEMPKSLIPIHGKPLLEHTLDLLRRYGFHDVVISTGHLGEQIQEHFSAGRRFGVNITYNDQKASIGTGGAIKALAANIFDEPFLVIHGDVLIDIDLDDLVNMHQESDNLITLALTSVDDPTAYGSVSVRRTKVVEFLEKPKEQSRSISNVINAGVYVVEPALIGHIGKTIPCSLERDVLPQLAKEGKVGAYVFDGEWIDVSTPDAYEYALKVWKK